MRFHYRPVKGEIQAVPERGIAELNSNDISEAPTELSVGVVQVGGHDRASQAALHLCPYERVASQSPLFGR
jgi:hypothetical protein